MWVGRGKRVNFRCSPCSASHSPGALPVNLRARNGVHIQLIKNSREYNANFFVCQLNLQSGAQMLGISHPKPRPFSWRARRRSLCLLRVMGDA